MILIRLITYNHLDMPNQQTTPQSEVQQIAERLKAVARLQMALSRIDKIETLRGELPIEVQHIEDELVGIHTRLENYTASAKNLTQSVTAEKTKIAQSRELLEKYRAQLDRVRNNREYDNLSKEIEYQELEVEYSEKKIREYTAELQTRKADITALKELYDLRSEDLKAKKGELDDIIKETHEEEERLRAKASELEKAIDDPRLLSGFMRIRSGARNGLAVVPIDRDACGGCFNRIPPQHQLEIKLCKKITICEYCGRIIIDPELMENA